MEDGPKLVLMKAGGNPVGSVAAGANYIDKKQARNVIRNFASPWYDTALLTLPASNSAAAFNQPFFTNPVGTVAAETVFGNPAGVNKGYASTNLDTTGGAIPAGQAFLSGSMGLAMFPAIIAGNITATNVFSQLPSDQVLMAAASYLVMKAGATTQLYLGTAAQWPCGFGTMAAIGGTGTAVSYGAVATNGVPGAHARNSFWGTPIAFNNVNSFRGNIISDNAINQSQTFRLVAQWVWWGVFTDTLGG